MTKLGISGAGFGFSFSSPRSITLKKGEAVIIHEWSWRKFKFLKKIIRIDSDGHINVRQI